MAACGYYLIGDVLDVLFDAPLAASRAYARATRLTPGLASAWRELGCELHTLGRVVQAKSALVKATRLNPNDGLAHDELELVLQSIAERRGAAYRVHDALNQAGEALARLQTQRALRLLGNRRSIEARQLRARVLGARECSTAQLSEWRAIERLGKPVRMTYGDWFFLTQTNYNSQEFWRLLVRLKDRLLDGIYPFNENSPPARTLAGRRRQLVSIFRENIARNARK